MGTILDHRFAGQLAALWRAKETGVVQVHAKGKTTTTIYLKQGTPVFADQGTVANTLGRVLIERRMLTQDELASAIDRMTDSLVGNEQVRLAEVLVELGFLPSDQVVAVLHEQIRASILQCFTWPTVAFDFQRGTEHLHDIQVFSCPVPTLLAEGIRRHYPPQWIDAALQPVKERFPRLAQPVDDVVRTYDLDRPSRSLLTCCKGEQTLGHIWDSNEQDRVVCGQQLITLLLGGALEFQSKPRSKGLPTAEAKPSPVPTSAPKSPQSTAQPTRPARRPTTGPRKHPMKHSGALRSLSAGHRELLKKRKQVKDKAPNDKTRHQGDAAYQQARRLHAQNALPKALEHYTKAADLVPDAVEYRMLATFVQMMLEKNNQRKQTLTAEATVLARKALHEQPESALAHNALGHIRALEGDTAAAIKHFESAARFDPEDADSARQVRLLRMRQTDSKRKPSLFRR